MGNYGISPCLLNICGVYKYNKKKGVISNNSILHFGNILHFYLSRHKHKYQEL